MAESNLVDRAFRAIRDSLIETGRAPHYAELARTLGIAVEEARQAQRDLMKTSYPGWVYPNTDLIASFAPFHNMPTQYRISVAGRPNGYAQ
jgi:hypothetical protein